MSGDPKQRIPVNGLFHSISQNIQLSAQIRDLLREYQSQMSALQCAVFQLRHISCHFHRQRRLNEPFQPRIKHGGNPVQDHPFDVTVFLIFQKSLDIGNYGYAHTFTVYNKNSRRVCGVRHVPGAGPDCGASNTVVVAHNSFQNSQVAVFAVFFQQPANSISSGKKGIQISASAANNPAVKHRVNIVRSAFKGSQPDPFAHQRLQDPAGDHGLSASAGWSCQ